MATSHTATEGCGFQAVSVTWLSLWSRRKWLVTVCRCGEQLATVPGNFLGCVLSCHVQLLSKHHQFVWLWVGEGRKWINHIFGFAYLYLDVPKKRRWHLIWKRLEKILSGLKKILRHVLSVACFPFPHWDGGHERLFRNKKGCCSAALEAPVWDGHLGTTAVVKILNAKKSVIFPRHLVPEAKSPLPLCARLTVKTKHGAGAADWCLLGLLQMTCVFFVGIIF